jgi:primosomal protein N'
VKSVLPEAVRKEKDGWKEQLFVRVLPQEGDLPKLTKRQQDVWKIVQEKKEIALQELLQLTETTTETVRRLEDKGLVSSWISVRTAQRGGRVKRHYRLEQEGKRALRESIIAAQRILDAVEEVWPNELTTGKWKPARQ